MNIHNKSVIEVDESSEEEIFNLKCLVYIILRYLFVKMKDIETVYFLFPF